MEEFSDIIETLKKAPRIKPPAGFVQAVMDRITPLQQPSAPVSPLRYHWVRLRKTLKSVPSRTEVIICFLIAGFFYLVMGTVLFVGLRQLKSLAAIPDWILFQPQIAVCSAVIFIVLGLLLYTEDQRVLKLASLCPIIYFGFAVTNAMGLHRSLSGSGAGLAILFLMGNSVVMGGFLAVMAQRYRQARENSMGANS